MDQGYNEEAAEQATKARKRLNVCKLATEYLYCKDQYDSDEMKFAEATERKSSKIVRTIHTKIKDQCTST